MAAKKKAAPKKNTAGVKQPPYQLFNAFPTNVLARNWDHIDELNGKLKERIWRQRALDPDGLYRSNLAGTWHSNDSLFETLEEDGETLKQMFAQAFVEWGGLHGLAKNEPVRLRQAAWAMVYSDRGYAAVHTHPNCHVSGVYYVDDTSQAQETIMATGVPVRSGDIEFLDTRTGGGHQSNLLKLNPGMVMSFKKGRMVIFPSSLPHYVHPIVGPGERIAVACNCTFLPVDPS